MPKPLTANTLFYGDNLPVLRAHFPTESVDLVYLDPPFNSNRAYNVLFQEGGRAADAQVAVFLDSWLWGAAAEEVYQELLVAAPPQVGTLMGALHSFVGPSPMLAYLVMMAVRLVELHRVLRSTGSLWLHCDPTASHYLKVLLDVIFGPAQFHSEVSWKRTSAHSSARRPGPIHDVLLFYSKTSAYTWNKQYHTYSAEYVEQSYRSTDAATGRRYQAVDLTGAGIRHGATGQPWRGIDPTAKGRHWMVPPADLEVLEQQGRIYWPPKGGMPRHKRFLDEMPGVPLQDIWTDIPPLGAQAAERLGYPTQKPLALLERIILASSNPGEVVLDPFCGCGTAVVAAEKLGRRWAGIDITHLAISLVRFRLRESLPEAQFQIVGEPRDLAAARQLAEDNRYQFEWWALSLVRARPVGSAGEERQGKKGRDRGIDGVINFVDGPAGAVQRVVVQVKSGHVKSGDLRDLRGVVEREGAAIGVFITLEPPSGEMRREVAAAGSYHSAVWGRDYPRLQIRTVGELLQGREIEMPPAHGTFKRAQRVTPEAGEQPPLL